MLIDEQTDLALFLIQLPDELREMSPVVMDIDSDPLSQGANLLTVGYQWEDAGYGQERLAISTGRKVVELELDRRTGVPTYRDLELWSDHGMSGGPIIVVADDGKITGNVSALVSRGFKGDPKSTAVSSKTLYVLHWEKQKVYGASAFPELIAEGQVRDNGRFARTIVVFRYGNTIISTRFRWAIVNSFILPYDSVVS
jgi:hypothetical protein